MPKDRDAFRERFLRWRLTGELPYEAGKPKHYEDGTEGAGTFLQKSANGVIAALRLAKQQQSPAYAPSGKYGINGQLYLDWKDYTEANAAAVQAAANQPQFRTDTRTATERKLLQQQAAVERERYRKQLQKEKAQEGFETLMSLTSPSTYVSQVVGLPIPVPIALAIDAIAFGAAGALKSGIKAAAGGVKNAAETLRYGTLGKPRIQKNYTAGVNPQTRTLVGDVEINNPGLYYHQSDAGKSKHFVETGRMRTPLEEYWLAKEEAGEKIPLTIMSGVEPGYPQDPGSAMFAQGGLWYGLTPNKPDLLVTAREMPIANKNASIMSDKASLKALYEQGSRRVTNDNIYTQGPHNTQNTAAYSYEPGYGYRQLVHQPSTISWQDAQEVSVTPRGSLSDEPLIARGTDDIRYGISASSSPYNLPSGTTSMFEKYLYDQITLHSAKELIEKGDRFPLWKAGQVVDMATPDELKQLYYNSVLPRMQFMRGTNWRGGLLRPTVKSNVDAALERGYSVYDKDIWNKSSSSLYEGFYDNNTGHIAIKQGSEDFALGHEYRHRLDKLLSKSPMESDILEDAYDTDFLTLPEHYPELKDVRMAHEAVTTNFDARLHAIGKYHALNTDWELLNKIIDKLPDDKIIDAVRNSNGYGGRYILWLENNGLLDTSWERKVFADKHRAAMKFVGALGVPTTLALPQLNK